jgi:hypothetical protein
MLLAPGLLTLLDFDPPSAESNGCVSPQDDHRGTACRRGAELQCPTSMERDSELARVRCKGAGESFGIC